MKKKGPSIATLIVPVLFLAFGIISLILYSDLIFGTKVSNINKFLQQGTVEANEGSAATLALTSCYKSLSQMDVSHLPEGSFELRVGDACLYLTETEAGDVFLYFFSPEQCFNRCEECRIDLTDFGSDAAACFIATLFDSYGRIVRYCDGKVGQRHWEQEAKNA